MALYTYGYQNPLKLVDPDGRSPENGTESSVDLEKMMTHLRNNATERSRGICAKSFRQGFEAAGGDSTGHPVSAKDWGPTLEKNGFEKQVRDKYEPKHGDVTVFAAVPPKNPEDAKDKGHPHGHIQAYDGKKKQQISDYLQNNPTPPAYKDASYSIYRFSPSGPSAPSAPARPAGSPIPAMSLVPSATDRRISVPVLFPGNHPNRM